MSFALLFFFCETGSNAWCFCIGACSRMVLQGIDLARLYFLLDLVSHVWSHGVLLIAPVEQLWRVLVGSRKSPSMALFYLWTFANCTEEGSYDKWNIDIPYNLSSYLSLLKWQHLVDLGCVGVQLARDLLGCQDMRVLWDEAVFMARAGRDPNTQGQDEADDAAIHAQILDQVWVGFDEELQELRHRHLYPYYGKLF